MMRQRQIAGQRHWLLAEFIVLLLLPHKLLCLVEPVFDAPQFFAKLFVGRSELSVFLGPFLSPSSLCIATSKQIPGRFVPRRLVLTDRFREKTS
jgi:hypothetical protein